MSARRKLEKARLEKFNDLPLPESLERAFSEIEKPMVRYADAPEARANEPKAAHDKR